MKIFCVLLLCLVVSSQNEKPIPSHHQCPNVMGKMKPCIIYLKITQGSITNATTCCDALKDAGKTFGHQTTCFCLTDTVRHDKDINRERAQLLPSACKLSLPYKIITDTDCTKDSFTSDVSVNSKPFVTQPFSDEGFMVDKKRVTANDMKVVSDDNELVSERVDLEAKNDDIPVLDKFGCVEQTKTTGVELLDNFVNKDVSGSEVKTVAAGVVDSDLKNKFNVYDEYVKFGSKEVGSDKVIVNKDAVVSDEHVENADKSDYLSDKKGIFGDQAVDSWETNCFVYSKNKMFIGDEDVEFAHTNYVVLKCYDVNVSANGDADIDNCADTLKIDAADMICASDTK